MKWMERAGEYVREPGSEVVCVCERTRKSERKREKERKGDVTNAYPTRVRGER